MSRENTFTGLFVIGFGIVGFGVLAIDPPDRWPASYPREDLRQHTLVFAGPEAVTITELDLDLDAETRATAALSDAGYYAAYAEGPGNRSGLWSGARTPALARNYALAACGEDCRVLAERRPQHAADAQDRSVLVLSHEMASRIGVEWPYVSGSGDALAIGGAGAWGTGHVGGRYGEFRRAVFRAVAECEARRSIEPTPEGVVSQPCQAMTLHEAEIVDVRPDAPLYPAAYEVSHTRLSLVQQDELRLTDGEGAVLTRAMRFRLPNELYGARASNGEGANGMVRAAGWPEAGTELALSVCEAERRLDDPPCAVVAQRMPPTPMPDGTIAVTPELMDGFREWEQLEGAGAFAISALGAWGSSYGLATPEEARQRAADWCAYYARRGNRPFTLRRAYIEQPPCRIVAERTP